MSLFYKINTSEAFAYSLIFGILLSSYFDFFRLIRKARRNNGIITFIEDIAYTLSSGIATFIFIFIISEGVFRLLELIGIIAGAALHHYVLSPPLMKFFEYVFAKIHHIFQFLYKNSVIRLYIYLDKFYKKGKIIIVKKMNSMFCEELSKMFLRLNERNSQNEAKAKNTKKI